MPDGEKGLSLRGTFPTERVLFRRRASLSVVVTGCRIHRNIGNNLSINFYVDLIYAVFQFLVIIWLDAVVFQQTFFKRSFPCVISGAVLVRWGIFALCGIRIG